MSNLNLQIIIKAANQMAGPVRAAVRQLGNLEKATERVNRAREKMNANLARAANISFVGGATQNIAGRIKGQVGDVLNSLRVVDRARAELATLGIDDMQAIIDRGKAMQDQYAGITAASFITAAYDIKSGISTLSDEGVASITESAAITAKATKATTEQMTSLFATSFALFKNQYDNLSDQDFGGVFAASLSKSVQQFKTTGADMQQAIQSAGAGAVNLGMKMNEQLAILGMAQASMNAGETGTSLRAFAENAAKAHEAFDDLYMSSDNPILVRILDESGNLRAMPDILTDMKERYGETLDAFESAEIKEAFGTTEALKLINTLWGQEEALNANVTALQGASKEGLEFAKSMAKAANAGIDADLTKLAQTTDLLKQTMATALLPAIQSIIPFVQNMTSSIRGWIDENPNLASAIGVVIVAIGGIASVLAPVFISLSAIIGSWGMLGFAIAKTAAFIGPAIGVIKALGLALTLNPIGAIVMGIALAAGLIYTYWEPIKEFFGNIWDWVEQRFAKAFEFVGGIIDKVSGAVSWVKDALGFGDGEAAIEVNQPMTIKKTALQTMAEQPRAANAKTEVNQQVAISIQQQPGQDASALADEVTRQLQAKTRGALFDAAGA